MALLMCVLILQVIIIKLRIINFDFLQSGAVFSRQVVPTVEWTLPIGNSSINGIWYKSSPSTLIEPFYPHENCFTLIIALCGSILADGTELMEGSYCFLPTSPAGECYILTGAKGTEFVVMTIPPLSTLFPGVPTKPFESKLTPTMSYLLAKMLILASGQLPMSRLLKQDGCYLIQLCLYHSSRKEDTLPFKEIYALTIHLHSMFHQTDAKSTVLQMANNCGLKTYRLQMLCKQLFGVSAHHILRYMKMQSALQLVASNQLTLNAIGEALGYSSDENFITAFRQYFQVTPHAFRKGTNHAKHAAFDML
jgi:AraC-like DNA-binding protein